MDSPFPSGLHDSVERARLDALDECDVLDTPPEEGFDALARLAARLCETPMALVTLLDGRRQWFKSAVGLGLRETAREIAFCAHTIGQDGLMQVEDALRDPRFAGNPLVTGEPRLRFYAGVPLRVAGGHALGSLAVLDRRPRSLTAAQQEDLQALARQVVVLLEERRQRRRAEAASAEALRQSSSLLAIAGRVARLGAWELDVASGRVTWSDVVAEIHGMAAGYAPDVHEALSFYAEPDRKLLTRAVEACSRSGVPFDFELVLQPRAGETRWVRSIGEAVRDAQGRITHLRGACQDITEHKGDITRREATLGQLRILDTCLRRLNDAVLITEADPRPPGPTIVFANEAALAMCGWSPQDLVGTSPRRLQGPLTQRDRLDALRRAMESGLPFETELINYRRTGEPYWVDLKLSPIHDDSGRCTHFVAVERDITGRKQAEAQHEVLEAQLRQAQKLESIGTLAGGIAHDFNNILGAILGSVALARDALPASGAALQPLATIEGSALRARSLVQQILAFGRQQPAQRLRQPLQPLIRDAGALLQSTLPPSIVLDLQLAPEDLCAEVDGNQLQQVLINLCTNAWQAMPASGGRIELALQAVTLDATAAAQASVAPGRHAHLRVSDDGCGIAPDALPRLFEPFFTTKPVGQGTGLGLSVAHGIVASHGGAIAAESVPGRGATFHIHLPLCDAGPAAGAGPMPGRDAPARPLQGLRVLCVDDDPVMLMTMQALLEREGCTVDACPDGPAALQRLREAPGGTDLLVTDMSMPGMDGLALVQAVSAVRPGLPIVMASGFLTDAVGEQATRLGVRALVQKERAVEDLVAAARSAVAASVAGR